MLPAESVAPIPNSVAAGAALQIAAKVTEISREVRFIGSTEESEHRYRNDFVTRGVPGEF